CIWPARAVELAPRGEVVAGVLEQPGDAVGDGAALVRWCAPVGLAVRLDRVIEVAVADMLLGCGTPAQPGHRPTQLGRLLPGLQGAGLVVEAVARRAHGQPGAAGHLWVGMVGQWFEDGERRSRIA